MDVQIKTLPDTQVIFKLKIGPYHESAPLAWQELWQSVYSNGLADKAKQMLGYGLDSPKITPAHMLRYFACIELAADASIDELADVQQQTIPGGRYAIYRMKGDYQKMPENFGRLHEEWLPASGEVPDYSRPCLEIYINNPDEVGLKNALTDLCLPIREQIKQNT